ncbi:hypothetical protein PYW08_009263 [Mythimna loreyi]|uniref:Uncharacterized protein n=1 Tax=Mythimna loreyi TaxID=667449 RepID=A0ACC2Q894_9NEOP|nr:hypothetical protein PYW08_009263 [Mythimna loreyi]
MPTVFDINMYLNVTRVDMVSHRNGSKAVNGICESPRSIELQVLSISYLRVPSASSVYVYAFMTSHSALRLARFKRLTNQRAERGKRLNIVNVKRTRTQRTVLQKTRNLLI